MKLPELLQSLNRISANGLSRHAQPEVVIPIYQPGRLGGQFAVPVTHINLGFDWDQGKLFLESDENLTLLSAEEVEDIRKHASLGQNRESHQRYVMLTNLLARIHRDGGQYVRQHGIDKAFADADAIVAGLYAAPVSEAEAQGVVMPEHETSTPSSKWASAGEPDPHGKTYDCERAELSMGEYTDDELANAVFMHDHRSFDIAATMRGEPGSIVLLTAAKERIRWLSRSLYKALACLNAATAAPAADAGLVDMYRHLQTVTPYRFKKIQDASITDGGDVMYFHKDRFDAALLADMAAHCAAKGVV